MVQIDLLSITSKLASYFDVPSVGQWPIAHSLLAEFSASLLMPWPVSEGNDDFFGYTFFSLEQSNVTVQQ